MPLDHYVTLGRSGLRVSPIALGGMTFGQELGWGSTEEESKSVIDRFFDRGGNFIDTANVYTLGHSEKIIGDHIGKNPQRRQRAVIATKFFGSLFPGDPNGGGSGLKAIQRQVENSLRRLQTDHVDLYWMHCYDKHTPIEETVSTLNDLVRQGKVLHIGFSDTPAWKVSEAQMIAKYLDKEPIIALQIEYSLLQRTVEGDLVPMALQHGLGITPWSPLRSGILTGKYTRENAGKVKADRGAWVDSGLNGKAYDVLDEVVRIARELDSSPARVSLAWVRQQPGVTSTIIGARTVQQLEDNLASLDVTLRKQDLEALDKVSKPTLNFPADFLKQAGTFSHGDTTVNGDTAPPWALGPKSDSKRW